MKSKYSNLFLSIVGPVLLWAAWPPLPITFFLFVAWLPLLIVAEHTKEARSFFGYCFLHMLLWNLLVTWWVAMSTLAGGLSAFLANSFIMCIPWMLYFFSKKYLNRTMALLALVIFWISYEYIHHNWDLSWPWLALGNAFALRPGWVQWYEYTGTSGGTLWIWLANVLMFLAFKVYQKEGRSLTYFKYLVSFLAITCLPIVFSIIVGKRIPIIHQDKYNVVVVQPNIDPWDEKFEPGKHQAQLQNLIALSQQLIDKGTALVVWPETAVPFAVDELSLKNNEAIAPVWNFLKQNPQLNLLTGIEGRKNFDVKVSPYARPFPDGSGYQEGYNSAALFDSAGTQIYHKSKLVPGVEVLPGFLNFMAPVFEKFGGTTGGYAKDSFAKVLTTTNNSFHITPAVCYESIYGDYLADFNRQGADLICIITNDGWWGNTAGHKQHKEYARLRAIESRKWVARSANTGISCFIDPYGNIVQDLGWNKKGALKQTIAAQVTETFYTKHGDVLSKVISWMAVVLLLYLVFIMVKNRLTK